MEKKCTGCGETKPLEEYYKQKAGKYGRRARCKLCKKAYKKAYEQSEAGKAYQKAYSQSEARKAYVKAYNQSISEESIHESIQTIRSGDSSQ